MAETSYGLIVEGPYDEGFYPELIRRIVPHDVRIIVRTCGGVSKLMNKLPGYLRELEFAWYGKPVDKALVIRDWDGSNLKLAEQAMEQKVQGRSFSFARGIQFCAVRQEMETWLLADEEAINIVAENRGGRRIPQISGQLEEIKDAKANFVSVLSQAQLPYDAKVCSEIAQNASLERLRYRCQSFRWFETKVLDC